jgi:DNA modification methylase
VSWRILQGDCRTTLRTLPAASVQTCVTSPPYFGLRDYGTLGQIGLEPTPDEFVQALVAVFREVRRVLRDDGTAWLNLGDSYNADGRKGRAHMGEGKNNGYSAWVNKTMDGTKPKDLLGIPWMVAFALRADGWWLRSDIIWAKPNPMPESVTDRPTSAHEHLFLLSKQPRYYFDSDAIREPHEDKQGLKRFATSGGSTNGYEPNHRGWVDGGGFTMKPGGREYNSAGRNKRNVWTVATQPYSDAHFATFPPKLIEPCILAGTPPKCCGECGAPWRRMVERKVRAPDERPTNRPIRHLGASRDYGSSLTSDHGTLGMVNEVRTIGWKPTCTHPDDTGRSVVLDPFAGAGTTGVVSLRHDRSFVGCELNPAYVEMARRRICDDAPLLNTFAELTEDAA